MTDTTDPTKPVAFRWKFKDASEWGGVDFKTPVESQYRHFDVEPLHGPSLLSEYEEKKKAAAHLSLTLAKETARSEALEAEVKRLCNLLNDTVVAWEALPGGQQSVKVVEKWLAEKMSAAINRIRAALEASR